MRAQTDWWLGAVRADVIKEGAKIAAMPVRRGSQPPSQRPPTGEEDLTALGVGASKRSLTLPDHLAAFSVEDLRTAADRWHLALTDTQLGSRKGLIQSLTAVLSRPGTLVAERPPLNLPERRVLEELILLGSRAGLTPLSTTLHLPPQDLLPILNELRLSGLVFPVGDWEQIAVPAGNGLPRGYVDYNGRRLLPAKFDLARPEPAPTTAACSARPGTLERDLAGFLGRVARGRLKHTAAGRLHKRDAKNLEPDLALGATPGYVEFLYNMALILELIEPLEESRLEVTDDANGYLCTPALPRLATLVAAWSALAGEVDFQDGDVMPLVHPIHGVPAFRCSFFDLFRTLLPGQTYSAQAILEVWAWQAPLLLVRYHLQYGPLAVVQRALRGLYWLGLVALDDPESPGYCQISALGTALLTLDPDRGLPPEEEQFVLQPNGEAFAPPNLAPLTYFHLRRVTGEKKGAPAGVFPITPASVTNTLESGESGEEILAFLNRFSRTGVPNTVKSMVDTAVRQFGRLQLAPTEYVLVTEDGALMQEILKLSTVRQHVEGLLTERVAPVPESSANALLRGLRARGYSPVDLREGFEAPPFPASLPSEIRDELMPGAPDPLPQRAPTTADIALLQFEAQADRPLPAAVWDGALPVPVYAALQDAAATQTRVKIRHRNSSGTTVDVPLLVLGLTDSSVYGYLGNGYGRSDIPFDRIELVTWEGPPRR